MAIGWAQVAMVTLGVAILCLCVPILAREVPVGLFVVAIP